MRMQIIGDIQGPWTLVFDRSPFEYQSVLSLAEWAEIEAALAENNLVRDDQRPDVITRDSVRVRVKPQRA